MRRAVVPILALLIATGCQRNPVPDTEPVEQQVPAARLTEVNGYYEADGGDSRLCVIGGRFGLVVQGRDAAGCSGSGRIEGESDRFRFTMRGDSACSFTAGVSGRTLLFPSEVPAGCSYYCASGASLAGVRLSQQGAGRDHATRAKDFAGDPLCEGR